MFYQVLFLQEHLNKTYEWTDIVTEVLSHNNITPTTVLLGPYKTNKTFQIWRYVNIHKINNTVEYQH